MQILSTLPAGVAQVFEGRQLHYNRAVVSKIIGGKFITYDFAFAPGYNNIFHNAHGLIRLSIDRKDGDHTLDVTEDCAVEVEAILFDYQYKQKGVKWRKINAKNLNEAAIKIIAWMQKNAEAMQQIEFK